MDCYRKIAIGDDLKNAMYYVVGTKIMKDYVISDIINKNSEFIVYIKKGNEIQAWKSFKDNVVTVKEFAVL